MIGETFTFTGTPAATNSRIIFKGVAGLAEVLTLIDALLRQYWAELHPRLDADDDNDPTVRINALTGLTCETNIRLLRESILTRSRTFGPVTLRAALNASGLQSFADEQLGNQQLNAAFLDSDPEQLQATRDALSAARAACEAIEQQVNDQVGSAQGVDLSALKQPLKQALQLLNQAVPGTDSSSDPEAVSEDNAPSVDNAAAPAAPRPSGDIATRDDVLRSLDKILAYYTRHEPSSPLPVLLTRAKNLVHADFAAIVRNLIPDGMSQFENLRGPESE